VFAELCVVNTIQILSFVTLSFCYGFEKQQTIGFLGIKAIIVKYCCMLPSVSKKG
jgi:hypothetical protein